MPKIRKGVVFTCSVIAFLVIYFQYLRFFLWKGINEILYFQSPQTDSAELFNSTSLQINFVEPSSITSSHGSCSLKTSVLFSQPFCLAVLHPASGITTSCKASAMSVESHGYTRGVCLSLQNYPAKISMVYQRYLSENRVPGETQTAQHQYWLKLHTYPMEDLELDKIYTSLSRVFCSYGRSISVLISLRERNHAGPEVTDW